MNVLFLSIRMYSQRRPNPPRLIIRVNKVDGSGQQEDICISQVAKSLILSKW